MIERREGGKAERKQKREGKSEEDREKTRKRERESLSTIVKKSASHDYTPKISTVDLERHKHDSCITLFFVFQ